MKLKELWQRLSSMFVPKDDELHFPSKEEVAQHTKHLQDQRKAKELEWADGGVPLKELIIKYGLLGKSYFCVRNNYSEIRYFFSAKWLWDEIVEWGEQEGILLSKEEVEGSDGFTTIHVSWERIK